MSKAAVILAAGSGSRFGGSPGEKLLAVTRGRPLLAHAVAPALEARLDELVVVSGSVDVSGAVPEDATILHNGQWQEGQATSLRVAIDWCQRQGHEAVVVGLGDLPGLTAEAWRAIADAPGGPIVVATYGGRRGHPVRLDEDVWPSLPIAGDEGARAVIARHPELVTEVACTGKSVDIDTREDLRRWS
ncbi:MAG TPA: nucleotidyltransferase family protein [Acidimicrobiales bacterium]|nr:nucleotidyltransferase family protein [Acidimicrobiales bacterium]